MIGGLVFGIIAIVHARIAQKKNNPAIGGMTTGIIGIGLTVIIFFVVLGFIGSEANWGESSYDRSYIGGHPSEEIEIERPDIDENIQRDIDDYDISIDIEDDRDKIVKGPPDIDRAERLPIPVSTDPPVIQESPTRFYTQLTPEQVWSFDRASLIILRKEERGNIYYDGFYTFYTSFVVELSHDGRLIADFDGRAPRVLGSVTGESGAVTAREIERTNTHVLYDVLVLLQGSWIDGWLEVELNIQSDEVSVLSLIPFDYIDHPPEERPEIDIFDTWAIAFPSYARVPTLGSDGRFLPFSDWERPGTMVGWEIVTDEEGIENFGFVMEYLDTDYDYYLFFNIFDTHGNITSSNITRIELD